MARNPRRRHVPAVDLTIKKKPGPYEAQILADVAAKAKQAQQSRADFAGSAEPARASVDRTMSPDTEFAVQLAKQGDDEILMPYQPTPTSNPGRPRTRAIGYDPKTRTMWIRFRESKKYPNGAVYEYYNVEPKHWKNVRRNDSPGKWMNRNLVDKYDYSRTDI